MKQTELTTTVDTENNRAHLLMLLPSLHSAVSASYYLLTVTSDGNLGEVLFPEQLK